jgi:hypothetical protein
LNVRGEVVTKLGNVTVSGHFSFTIMEVGFVKKLLMVLISFLVFTACPAFAANLQGDWVGVESKSTIHIEQSGNMLTGTYRWQDKVDLPVTGSAFQDIVTLKVKFDTADKLQKWAPFLPYTATVQAAGVEALLVARQLNNDFLSGIWIRPSLEFDDLGNIIRQANGGTESSAKNISPESGISFIRKQ